MRQGAGGGLQRRREESHLLKKGSGPDLMFDYALVRDQRLNLFWCRRSKDQWRTCGICLGSSPVEPMSSNTFTNSSTAGPGTTPPFRRFAGAGTRWIPTPARRRSATFALAARRRCAGGRHHRRQSQLILPTGISLRPTWARHHRQWLRSLGFRANMSWRVTNRTTS